MLNRERRGDYLGKTVQIVPHATDLIQNWIEDVAKIPVDGSGDIYCCNCNHNFLWFIMYLWTPSLGLEPDVCLIEVGGTVGDIESMVFLEALRQFQFRVGKENFLLIHVSLVPFASGIYTYTCTYSRLFLMFISSSKESKRRNPHSIQ